MTTLIGIQVFRTMHHDIILSYSKDSHLWISINSHYDGHIDWQTENQITVANSKESPYLVVTDGTKTVVILARKTGTTEIWTIKSFSWKGKTQLQVIEKAIDYVS